MIGRYCLILTIYISCEPGPNRLSCVQRIGVMCLANRREITCASRVYAEIPEFARFFFSCGSLPRSTQNSLPREIPWRELTGIWPPSFARRARCKATGNAPGGRDRRASFELRCGGWFHRSEVPFGTARGYLGDRSASRLMPPAVGRGCRAYRSDGNSTLCEISHHFEDAGRRFAARRAAEAVASLNRWRGMLRRAKRRRFSGSVSKSASMKISTVSSLA
jgi:hypothetical protein